MRSDPRNSHSYVMENSPMTFKKLIGAGLAALAAAVFIAEPAMAQAAPTVNKGDTTWMMVATIIVLLMTVPGLALFYGGLVRSKNMLSMLMQVLMITAVIIIVWVLYGYSLAFGGGTSPYWGGLAKVFLAGVTPDSLAATFTDEVIPEYVF